MQEREIAHSKGGSSMARTGCARDETIKSRQDLGQSIALVE
jgi:hypothetical protein